jgi:hypothetical protein
VVKKKYSHFFSPIGKRKRRRKKTGEKNGKKTEQKVSDRNS